jgi:predicted transposase YbfD/YdcC
MVRNGKVTTLTRYYITSRTAAQLLEAVRGHWAIENSVHWVLDVVFGDADSAPPMAPATWRWSSASHST